MNFVSLPIFLKVSVGVSLERIMTDALEDHEGTVSIGDSVSLLQKVKSEIGSQGWQVTLHDIHL